MIAFVCDQPECGTKQPVDMIVLPKSWLEISATESIGATNNPKKTLHFCPACAAKMRGAMPALVGIAR